MDAIAEVYASIFGPDPIEYRAARGLLDVHEEMGVMIQEVVGSRVGKYFLPTYAGVAFSNNEFRWSARIKREDGLVRLVAGSRNARRGPPRRRLPGADRSGPARAEGERHPRRGGPLLAEEAGRHQHGVGALRDGHLEGPPRGVRPGDPRGAADRLARGWREHPPAPPDRLGEGRGPSRRHLRRAHRVHVLPHPDARAAPPSQGEDGRAGGHRVRLGRKGLLPPAVPAAELLGGRRVVADPPASCRPTR